MAVRLIKKLSPYCSDPLFHKLEYALVHYHSPEEKELARYYLKKSRESYYGHWFGQTQYFLLPALAPKRRSDYTNNLIRVLKRKFGEGKRFPRRSSGGWVDSPLRTEVLHRISDQAWLAIVSNKKIQEDALPKMRRHGKYVNSSIGNFSSGLRWIAKRQPKRFARLALRFPADVDRRYVGAVLDAVKAIKSEDLSEEEKADWAPASREAILERFSAGNDVSTALEFAWLIEARADKMWSQRVIDRLIEYASNHPHPEPQKLSSHSVKSIDQATVHDLEHETLNSVRGVAGRAIGALLWKHHDWFDRLRPGIEHLIQDLHPAVRIGSLDACLATVQISKDLAVELFCRACEEELRVAASRMAVYMFNTAMHTHSGLLSPIVGQTLKSQLQDVAREGAAEVTARWLFHGMFEHELAECKGGSVAHRKGVAQVVVYHRKWH